MKIKIWENFKPLPDFMQTVSRVGCRCQKCGNDDLKQGCGKKWADTGTAFVHYAQSAATTFYLCDGCLSVFKATQSAAKTPENSLI